MIAMMERSDGKDTTWRPAFLRRDSETGSSRGSRELVRLHISGSLADQDYLMIRKDEML